MSNVLGALFQEIADSIRAKSGDTATMKPTEFPEKISAIEAGGGEADERVKYVTFMDGASSEIIAQKEQTFSHGSGSGVSMTTLSVDDGSWGVASVVAFVNASKCFVYFDGTIYEANKTIITSDVEGSEIHHIGNLSLNSEGTDTGEPFLITLYTDTPETVIVKAKETTTDTSVTHTIGVYTETAKLLVYPVIEGDTVRDPVAKGYIEAPTKEQTVSTVYSYSGWSLTNGGSASASALQNVTEDRVVYAAFAESARMYTVNFYDGETLVNTEQVAYGGSSTYEYGKDGCIFTGWTPEPTNITGDLDCYANYIEGIDTLENSSWNTISAVSEAGQAANYWAVGDTKSVLINGTVGKLTVNATYYVYIIGIDHNSSLEGKGITFGTFKTADGIDVALCDSKYNSYTTDGSKYFNYNHWGEKNQGGWAGCDMRYDILGSTDVAPSAYGSIKTTSTVGYDPTETCATNPVENTLMAALPENLRAVMKPMTVYTDNTGGGTNVSGNVTASVDYLPLLSEFEVWGARQDANQYEKNKQAQYAYFASGKSKNKYIHSSTASYASWRLRSVACGNSITACIVQCQSSGISKSKMGVCNICGLAPIFKV